MIVPLAHPNGVYIRLENNIKVPILAKVRSVFADTANVINFFGAIYNVPIIHIEQIRQTDYRFYLDMIEFATHVYREFGYEPVDNSDFFNTTQTTTTYTFLTHLPGYESIVYSDVPAIIDVPSGVKTIISDTFRIPIQSDQTRFGVIRVMAIQNCSLLHVVERPGSKILFNNRDGELIIYGYGRFICRRSYTYSTNSTKCVIFKSEENYIHIKERDIIYTDRIDERESGEKYVYEVKTKKPDKDKPKDRKYIDIIRIITNEFF